MCVCVCVCVCVCASYVAKGVCAVARRVDVTRRRGVCVCVCVCVCASYVAEGVCAVARGVDVTRRRGSVSVHGRGVREDGWLPRVTGAHAHGC